MMTTEDKPQAQPVSDKIQREIEKSKADQLFQQGVLIDLTICKQGWNIRLTDKDVIITKDVFGDDVERPMTEAEKQAIPENIKLGHRRLLLPKHTEKVEQIERHARAFLDDKSFPFGSRHQKRQARVRFVHISKVPYVLGELEDRRTAFFSAVDELIENYETYKEEMREKFPDQWNLLQTFYPEPGRIRAGYSFDFQAYGISFPSALDVVDIAKAKNMDAETKAHAAHLRNIRESTRRSMEQQVSGFVEQVFTDVRARAVDVFTGITDRIKEGKPMTGRSLNRIRDVIAEVKDMDFMDDREFKAKLDEIAGHLEGVDTLKDDEAMTRQLSNMMQSVVEFHNQNTAEHAAARTQTYFKRRLS